jgi:hypothetical protein
VVLELQAQFGNKWARIATYLPGRTDNDVKNFWSTRQKRLARLLRAPLPARSSKNSSGKAPAASSLESRPATVVSTCNSHCPLLPIPPATDIFQEMIMRNLQSFAPRIL